MKKILLLFLLGVLMPITAGAQTPTDDTFTVSDLTHSKENIYSFIVSLSGSDTYYTACNLDLFLPTGFSFAKNSAGNYRILITQSGDQHVYPTKLVEDGEDDEGEPIYKTIYPHTISFSVSESNNSARIAIKDLDGNMPFTKTSGQLFKVFVTVNESVFTSSFSPKPIVRLSGLNLTTPAAVKFVPADFACRPFTTGIPTERTLPVNVSAANKVGTLILPFDAELPSGLKAYSCNAAEGDLLTLAPAESIEACTPYIVYAENGYSGNLSGTAELPDASNVTDVFTDGLLTGLLTSGVVSTGYILQNKGEGPIFYDADGVNFSLPAGRCYLTSSGSGVKAFQFAFDDDATGISNVRSKMEDVREKIFDLAGRQVSSPQHGIYIQGTRKVIVK